MSQELIQAYLELVQQFQDGSKRKDFIRIIASVSGGTSTEAGIFFNDKGSLKKYKELKQLADQQLRFIFKQNVLQSNNSVMLLENLRLWDLNQQNWKTFDAQLRSNRENNPPQQTAGQIRSRLLRKDYGLHIFLTHKLHPRNATGLLNAVSKSKRCRKDGCNLQIL